MKILLAVDGSKYTKRMLGYVTAHEELFGPAHDYTVATVVAPITPRAASVLGKEAVDAYYHDSAEDVLKPVRKFFEKQSLKAKFVMKTGHAGDTLAKMADAGKFDLVVMGSHGHGTLGNLIMGSVATRVLAGSKAPVLLVR